MNDHYNEIDETGNNGSEEEEKDSIFWSLIDVLLNPFGGPDEDTDEEDEEEDGDDDYYGEEYNGDEIEDEEDNENDNFVGQQRNSTKSLFVIKLVTISDGLWRLPDNTLLTDDTTDLFKFCNFLKNNPKYTELCSIIDNSNNNIDRSDQSQVISQYEFSILKFESLAQKNEDANSKNGGKTEREENDQEEFDNSSYFYYAYKENDDEEYDIDATHLLLTQQHSFPNSSSKCKETDDEGDVLKSSNNSINESEDKISSMTVIPINGLRSRSLGNIHGTTQEVNIPDNHDNLRSITEDGKITYEVQIDGITVDNNRRFFRVKESAFKFYEFSKEWYHYRVASQIGRIIPDSDYLKDKKKNVSFSNNSN